MVDCSVYQNRINELSAELVALDDLLAKASPADKAGPLAYFVLREKQVRANLATAQTLFAQCGISHRITIVGIEQTQAIQFFNYPPGQGSGFAANNSIPLISGKPTALRVYVDVDLTGGGLWTPQQVTGYLDVDGPAGKSRISPRNGAITAKAATSTNRVSLDDTLNFVIPRLMSMDKVQCHLEAFDPVNHLDLASADFVLSFVDVPLVPVHSVLIHYTGPWAGPPTDHQATPLDVAFALDYVLRTFPLSGFVFDGCQVLEWSKDLTIAQNFYDLSGELAKLQAMSAGDLYIGLIRGAACGGVCGLGGGMTALFFAADGPEASHEIAHAFGRPHTPCDKAKAPGEDPNYPVYQNFPRGSIGEVGLDVLRDTTYNPMNAYDFLSYCAPTWVSPWTYLHLYDWIVTNIGGMGGGGQGDARSSSAGQTSEFYYIAFRVHRIGAGAVSPHVEITDAFHLRRRPPRSQVAHSDVTVELVADRGVLIDSQPAVAIDAHTDENALFVDHRATFLAHPNLRAVRVVARGVELVEWPLASDPPTVAIPEVRTGHNMLRVRWSAEAGADLEPPISFGVRYSADGERWRALAAGIVANELTANLDLLPGGDSCRVQVIASAGFRSAVAISEPFRVDKKGRRPVIASPTPGAEYEVGAPIPLVGAAFSPDWGSTDPDEVAWTTRAIGVLGVGHQVTIANLPVGRHQIAMYAPDGADGEVTATVPIRVVPKRPCAV
jgi:hypothetical protein